jgi:hypothetical protein
VGNEHGPLIRARDRYGFAVIKECRRAGRIHAAAAAGRIHEHQTMRTPGKNKIPQPPQTESKIVASRVSFRENRALDQILADRAQIERLVRAQGATPKCSWNAPDPMVFLNLLNRPQSILGAARKRAARARKTHTAPRLLHFLLHKSGFA